MVPTPLSIGLTLCHSIIIEEGTRNLTLVGSFYDFQASEFPFTPLRFGPSPLWLEEMGKGSWS